MPRRSGRYRYPPGLRCLQESLVSLTVGLGAVCASVLIDLTSVSAAMVAVGVLCPILVAATWRRFGRPDRNIGELDKEIGLLRAHAAAATAAGYRIPRAAWNRSTCLPARRCFARVIRPTAST